MEDHSPGPFLVNVGCGHQVPGDGFPFSVRVSGQVDLGRSGNGRLKLFHHLSFLIGHSVGGLEVALDVY